MPNKKINFLQETEDIFKNHLSETKIMIREKSSQKILDNISYKNILFDSNMNFYKIVGEEIQRVENPNFEVVFVRNGNVLK